MEETEEILNILFEIWIVEEISRLEDIARHILENKTLKAVETWVKRTKKNNLNGGENQQIFYLKFSLTSIEQEIELLKEEIFDNSDSSIWSEFIKMISPPK